jgi:hypothetical protein
MTTRQDLEREREALEAMREHFGDDGWRHPALTASIARIDALLSLSDKQCAYLTEHNDDFERAFRADARCPQADSEDDDVALAAEYLTRAAAHRTVADLVRRSS